MILYMDVSGFESCSELFGGSVVKSGSIAQLPEGSGFLQCFFDGVCSFADSFPF